MLTDNAPWSRLSIICDDYDHKLVSITSCTLPWLIEQCHSILLGSLARQIVQYRPHDHHMITQQKGTQTDSILDFPGRQTILSQFFSQKIVDLAGARGLAWIICVWDSSKPCNFSSGWVRAVFHPHSPLDIFKIRLDYDLRIHRFCTSIGLPVKRKVQVVVLLSVQRFEWIFGGKMAIYLLNPKSCFAKEQRIGLSACYDGTSGADDFAVFS